MRLKPGDLVIPTEDAKNRFSIFGYIFVIAEVRAVDNSNGDVLLGSISDQFPVPHAGFWAETFLIKIN